MGKQTTRVNIEDELDSIIGPATEAKQDDIISAIQALSIGGGGVQYTEGDTDATITGTAALVEGAANALAPMTQPLTDTQLRATPVPISGTVTANLGTTDTSALAAINTVLGLTTDEYSGTGPSTINARLDGIRLGIGNVETALGILNSTIRVDEGAPFTFESDYFMPIGGVYTTTPDAITDGYTGIARIDSKRNLQVNVRDASDAQIDFATQTTLAAIKAKTDNIPALGQALDAASVPVVLTAAQITTLTPPAAITGFATSAKQDTIIGHIDGIETLLGTIDVDTSNISTKIDTLASAVAGTEVQVDVLTMPTTTVQATNLDIRDLTATDVVTAEIKPLASCGSGVTTVTTAGTQVALGSSTAIDSVTIKALSTNTGLIYVGTSTVSSADGFQLSAGDSVSLDIDNLTDVYVDSAVNGESVSYIFVT